MYLFCIGGAGMKLMKNYTDVKKDGINMRTKKYIFLLINYSEPANDM